MPLSLKTMLKKFVHKGQITQEEYDALIKKLDGHDKEIRNKAIDEFAYKVKQLMCSTDYPNCPFGFGDIDEIEQKLKGE